MYLHLMFAIVAMGGECAVFNSQMRNDGDDAWRWRIVVALCFSHERNVEMCTMGSCCPYMEGIMIHEWREGCL